MPRTKGTDAELRSYSAITIYFARTAAWPYRRAEDCHHRHARTIPCKEGNHPEGLQDGHLPCHHVPGLPRQAVLHRSIQKHLPGCTSVFDAHTLCRHDDRFPSQKISRRDLGLSDWSGGQAEFVSAALDANTPAYTKHQELRNALKSAVQPLLELPDNGSTPELPLPCH